MWIELTADHLLTRVAGAEKSALERAALASGQEDVLDDIVEQVAAEWRSGLRRVTTLDTRDNYVPSELLTHILADFRYRAYTRLPGMGTLLDDVRREEWRRANQVRDNLNKVSIEAPDDDYAEASASSGSPSPTFSVPASVLEDDSTSDE